MGKEAEIELQSSFHNLEEGSSLKQTGTDGSLLSVLHSLLTQSYFGCIPVLHRLDNIHYNNCNTHIYTSIYLFQLFFQHFLFSLSPVLCLLLWLRLRLCVYVISPLRYLDKADTPPSRPSGYIRPHQKYGSVSLLFSPSSFSNPNNYDISRCETPPSSSVFPFTPCSRHVLQEAVQCIPACLAHEERQQSGL